MPSPGLVRVCARRAAPASATTAASPPGYDGAGLLRLDDRQAGRLGRGRAARRSRGWRGRSSEYDVARHPDDHPVLPLADARAGFRRGTLRHDLSRSPAGRAARRVFQRALRVGRGRGCDRGCRRMAALRQQPAIAAAPERRRTARGSAQRGRKACAARADGLRVIAGDLRIEINGRDASVSIRARRRDGRVPRRRSTREVDARRRAAQRRIRLSLLLSRGTATTSAAVAVRAGNAAPGELLAYLNGRTGRSRGQRPPHRPRRADGGGRRRDGEQKVVGADAGPRRPRPGRRRRPRRSPPAARGRRSDEDGKRAAVAQGRPGQGRHRDRGHSPSRPARVLVVIE